MKKIKLDSAKLIFKKEIIGNLTNSEMANLIGGYGDTTGAGMCTDYTQQGDTQCQSDYQGNCTGPFPSAGCPPTRAQDCTQPPMSVTCILVGPTCHGGATCNGRC